MWVLDDYFESKKKQHMRVFLASNNALPVWGGCYTEDICNKFRPYILESFYYANEDTERMIPYFGDFLLDSGAFTFMENAHIRIEWEDYVERYADFINRNHVEKFFELDIDSVVGYEKVKEYRRVLERLTNKPCIPVWHKGRGYEEYLRQADEYKYIAVGGIVSGEIKKNNYPMFTKLIQEAHKRDTRVHGLGFTNLEGLKKYHFDSVDSTAWTAGNRFGYIYQFNGHTMTKHIVPSGKKMKDPKKVALNNFLEWVKFSKYADAHY